MIIRNKLKEGYRSSSHKSKKRQRWINRLYLRSENFRKWKQKQMYKIRKEIQKVKDYFKYQPVIQYMDIDSDHHGALYVTTDLKHIPQKYYDKAEERREHFYKFGSGIARAYRPRRVEVKGPVPKKKAPKLDESIKIRFDDGVAELITDPVIPFSVSNNWFTSPLTKEVSQDISTEVRTKDTKD